MDQNTKITSQIDLESYPFRYTIDFHLKVRSAQLGATLSAIKQELLAKLDSKGIGMSERMLDRYRMQRQDSDDSKLNEERLALIGEYFGVPADEIITDNIRQMRRA